MRFHPRKMLAWVRIISLQVKLRSARENSRLEDPGGNIGLYPILFQGGQKGPQAYFLILYAQLGPDIVPVKIDRALRQVHDRRYFLCSSPLLHEIGNLKLRMRKPQEFGPQVAYQW